MKNSEKIITHFLATGELPKDKNELNIEDFVDSNGFFLWRSYYDAVLHKDSYLDELSEEQLWLIISNREKDPLEEEKFMLFYLYYPDIVLKSLKDTVFLNEVFIEKKEKSIDLMEYLINILLGIIDIGASGFLDDNNTLLRLSNYIKLSEDYLINLSNKIDELQDSFRRPITKTYNLQISDKERKELFKQLKEEQLFDLKTTYNQFENITTAESINIIDPIKWHDGNASELLFFAIKLEEFCQTSTPNHNNPIVYSSIRHNYKRLKACFVKPDGKVFEAKFKQLKTTIEMNLSPEKQRSIKNIFYIFS